jgi:hypothetical protein
MNLLKAGFSRVNVTPMMGIHVRGYFKPRYAKGVLDELEINTIALACGESKALLMSIDNCGLNKALLDQYRQHISQVTGVNVEGIFISATHTHTGPGRSLVASGESDQLSDAYEHFLIGKFAEAAELALADLQPAKMGYGIGQAPNIAFVRRFRMKDGSVKTNPGVNNPDIVAPIGDVDERVNVLRFDRESGDSLVLVNFGDHPDVVGGELISADWPGFLRSTVEKVLDNTKCVFFNGAQGDVNHVNVHPTGGYLNGMFMDFDDVARGYDHARYMGRVVAAGVLQAFDKVQYEDVSSLRFLQRDIQVPSQKAAPEDLPEAHRIHELHLAGKDHELPYTGMMLTTIVAEAGRMVRLENGPDSFDMPLTGIAIGNVALVGIPGEPFTGIGRGIKDTPGWGLILPCCLTNGSEGYFPMQDSYDEGGYEARSSNFRSGVAELIIAQSKAVLAALAEN